MVLLSSAELIHQPLMSGINSLGQGDLRSFCIDFIVSAGLVFPQELSEETPTFADEAPSGGFDIDSIALKAHSASSSLPHEPAFQAFHLVNQV